LHARSAAFGLDPAADGVSERVVLILGAVLVYAPVE
jgi:hypothetical protein